MEQNTTEQIKKLLLPDKYKESPNKDRSLENVIFKDVNSLQASIIGEIKPQSKNDYDMTHKIAISAAKGKFAGAYTCS